MNKKKRLKYYLGKIHEQNGEKEYTSQYLFKTLKCPVEYNINTAMAWRGSSDEDFDEDSGGCNCDGTLITPHSVRKIPEEHYKILRKYLVEL